MLLKINQDLKLAEPLDNIPRLKLKFPEDENDFKEDKSWDTKSEEEVESDKASNNGNANLINNSDNEGDSIDDEVD
jgi:hypothetical protein